MSGNDQAGDRIGLSICVPIYNFGEFIGETLKSILPQVGEGIEVVVFDGGSTDDTPAVVGGLQESFPALRYHRREQRGGIDRDMALTVELARGEYCWLFSGDDLMRPRAVAEILEEIESGQDIYLCGLTICSREMRPMREHRILDLPSDSIFDLSHDDDRRRYFEQAQTTTAFFSFLGSVIFKKSRWDAIPLDEEFVGSCWAHVARIFRMVPDGLTVKYLPSSHLWKRSDNDSFMEAGLIRRYAISIDGYHRLARTFFGEDSWEAWHIRRVVAAEFWPGAMLYAKLVTRNAPREDRATLERLAAKVYRDSSLTNRLYSGIYRLTPIAVFRVFLPLGVTLRRAHERVVLQAHRWAKAIRESTPRLLPTREQRGGQPLPLALARVGAGFLRRRVLRSRDIEVELDGRGVYFNIDLDTAAGMHIYRHGWHDQAAQAIERLVRPGDIVVDGGANIGGFTLTAASVVGPTGVVHAIEAAPNTAELLRRTVSANPRYSIVVHELALADVAGEFEFSAFEAGSGISSLAPARAGTVIRVRATTLDALTAPLPRVDLVKLDLEGAELRALQGATRLLAEQRPVLVIELEPDHLARQGGSIEAIEALLSDAGYEAFTIAPSEEGLRFPPLQTPWRRPSGSPNVIAAPLERSASLLLGS